MTSSRLHRLLILLPICATAHVSAQAPVTTVDLVDLNNTIAVRATVGGKDALLIIDTGSYELRLRKEFVAKSALKLQRAGHELYGSGELRIGDFTDPRAKIIVQDDAPLPFEGDASKARVDGIVGLSFLQKHAIGIDMVAHRFSIWENGKLDDHWISQWLGVAGPPRTFALKGNPAEGAWYRVKTQINGKNLNFVLDTGSTWTTIAPRHATSLTMTRLGDVASFSFNGTSTVTACLAKSVLFGPVALPNQVVAIDRADDEYDGLLGLESIRNCKLILDFPGQVAMVNRISTFVKPQRESPLLAIGIELMRLSDDRLMAVVASGSPAEKAGVRTGDVLVSLNGRAAAELVALMKENAREDSVQAWSAALTRKTYSLVIKSPDGATKKLSLPRT